MGSTSERRTRRFSAGEAEAIVALLVTRSDSGSRVTRGVQRFQQWLDAKRSSDSGSRVTAEDADGGKQSRVRKAGVFGALPFW